MFQRFPPRVRESDKRKHFNSAIHTQAHRFSFHRPGEPDRQETTCLKTVVTANYWKTHQKNAASINRKIGPIE